MNQGKWTTAEKKFVTENVGKLSLQEMSDRINRSPVAVKMFILRNRIDIGNKVNRNILQEILKIKFVHPEYFHPTRSFYKEVNISQTRFWDLYYGRVSITQKEYIAITTHLGVTLQEAFEARQLNLFEGDLNNE